MNDVFSKNSEAWGQYKYPSQVHFINLDSDSIPNIEPNYNFDLCRLSMTILEEIDAKSINKLILQFLNSMCIDRYGKHFCDMEDNFSLYINIAKNAVNSLPFDILNNVIFKKYRVKKKNFPLKSYYNA